MEIEERPPYVEFVTKGMEDRNKTIETGCYSTKAVDFALITPMGSKDRIERNVADWFASLTEQVQQKRFKGEWLRGYKEAYAAWKDGRELPVNGTPVATWPSISPEQVEQLLRAKCKTVEDLAAANEELMSGIGMGARALKEKAISWLAAASGTGQFAEKLAAAHVENDNLKLRQVSLEEQVKTLTALVLKFVPANQVPQLAVVEDKTESRAESA